MFGGTSVCTANEAYFPLLVVILCVYNIFVDRHHTTKWENDYITTLSNNKLCLWNKWSCVLIPYYSYCCIIIFFMKGGEDEAQHLSLKDTKKDLHPRCHTRPGHHHGTPSPCSPSLPVPHYATCHAPVQKKTGTAECHCLDWCTDAGGQWGLAAASV